MKTGDRVYRNNCRFCGKPLVPLERGIWTKKYGYLDGYWEHRDEDYANCPQVITDSSEPKK